MRFIGVVCSGAALLLLLLLLSHQSAAYRDCNAIPCASGYYCCEIGCCRDDQSIGTIIGIVVGVAVAIMIVIVICCCCSSCYLYKAYSKSRNRNEISIRTGHTSERIPPSEYAEMQWCDQWILQQQLQQIQQIQQHQQQELEFQQQQQQEIQRQQQQQELRQQHLQQQSDVSPPYPLIMTTSDPSPPPYSSVAGNVWTIRQGF